MQFRVETGGLRESAAAIEEVLARLERVGVSHDLAAVGVAFCGGESATAAAQACSTWGVRLTSLRWRVRSTGAALVAAATGYEVVDDVARRALRPAPLFGRAPSGAPTATRNAAR